MRATNLFLHICPPTAAQPAQPAHDIAPSHRPKSEIPCFPTLGPVGRWPISSRPFAVNPGRTKIIVFTDLHMLPEGGRIIGLHPYEDYELSAAPPLSTARAPASSVHAG
jgi:hypothetical protein